MIPILVGCQFCKDLLNYGLAKGFYWTCLLLLAVPFTLVAVITTKIVRAGRRRTPHS